MTANSDALLREVTVESIRLRLGHYDDSRTVGPNWAEFMEEYGECQAFGELRDPIDWRGLPKEKHLRVVWLVDDKGSVVRWLWPEHKYADILGGIFHDYLERGDGHGEARSGWLWVSDAGVRVDP